LVRTTVRRERAAFRAAVHLAISSLTLVAGHEAAHLLDPMGRPELVAPVSTGQATGSGWRLSVQSRAAIAAATIRTSCRESPYAAHGIIYELPLASMPARVGASA
jgi:hypothetical protein